MTAQNDLDSGRKYPYDQLDDDESETPASDWAHAAARGILSNLKGRGGIGNELEHLDEELRKEVIDEAADIIRLAHTQRDTTLPRE